MLILANWVLLMCQFTLRTKGNSLKTVHHSCDNKTLDSFELKALSKTCNLSINAAVE